MRSPKTVLATWNLKAKKHFGQNFLVNANTADSIVRRVELKESDCVLEIGPGLGALTHPLARRVKRVWAVEKDYRLVELLRNELSSAAVDNVFIQQGDILTVNLQEVSEALGQNPIIIGNLPYNVSSQILVRLIKNRQYVDHAVLMFQKELADRLLAHPGSRDYGRLTVMLNYCTDIHPIMELTADQFFPKPNINSTILDIRFLEPLPHKVEDEALLFDIIKAAFGKRRKTLRNSLSNSDLGITANMAEEMLYAVGIDPQKRAETLRICEFASLCRLLTELRHNSIPVTSCDYGSHQMIEKEIV